MGRECVVGKYSFGPKDDGPGILRGFFDLGRLACERSSGTRVLASAIQQIRGQHNRRVGQLLIGVRNDEEAWEQE